MKSDRKPPLAKSPMRLRTRRVLKPTDPNTIARTPIGSMNKAQMKDSSELRPEYQTMSCELRALSKLVQDELGVMSAKAVMVSNTTANNTNSLGMGSLFERGRFYDEYSARRNERLRKRQGGTGEIDEPKTAYNLGVKVDSAMKKDSKKKTESLKKSVAATYSSVDRSQHPRYALRSTTKKPPLPVPTMNVEGTTMRKTTVASRTRRK